MYMSLGRTNRQLPGRCGYVFCDYCFRLFLGNNIHAYDEIRTGFSYLIVHTLNVIFRPQTSEVIKASLIVNMKYEQLRLNDIA